MSKTSCAVLMAALLCSGLPAMGQQLPGGPGKELAEANCNSCHTLLSRVGSGYTPNGWNTVLRMMANRSFDPRPLAETYRLDDWEQAFADVESRKVVKAVILPA